MTDRPILFNAAMVNAILDDRKTQTRRVLKPQPFLNDDGFVRGNAEMGWIDDVLQPVDPKYQVGDRLWVRENCSAIELESGDDVILYPADGAKIIIDNTIEAADRWGVMNHYGNRRNAVVPSIHMPRWVSRLTLVVIDVRVQRVAEISETDARAEGVEPAGVFSDMPHYVDYLGGDCDLPLEARHSFETLWNSINDARGFGTDVNPWVVAVTFETHKCNIDQMEAVA